MIVLETALPIKFAATIVEALGCEPDRPAKFRGHRVAPTACDRDTGAGAGSEAFSSPRNVPEMCFTPACFGHEQLSI
jgi:threonine synthase